MAKSLEAHAIRAGHTGVKYSGVPKRAPERATYGLVGGSQVMEEVRRQIAVLGPSRVPVLILGETGTGKDLCAQALGQLSGRRPFVAVNCAAIPESLVESELFGHEPGAFTGAVRSRDGLIATADSGVLFLDELAELPFSIQAKLLRSLQSGEYRRLGATTERRSDFRILAATSGDVDGNAGAPRIYAALLHRLGAARIVIPPLRERIEDIPQLAADFLRTAPLSEWRDYTLAPEATAALMREEWPGNVRQLKNVVEVAAVYAGGLPVIRIEHVNEALPSKRRRTTARDTTPLAEVRRRAEQQAIMEALQLTGGNRQQAARHLQISEATLYRKLQVGAARSNGSQT